MKYLSILTFPLLVIIFSSCGISNMDKEEMKKKFTYTIVQDYAKYINLISKDDEVELNDFKSSNLKEGKYQAYFTYSFTPLNDNFDPGKKVTIYGVVYFTDDKNVVVLENGLQAIDVDLIKIGFNPIPDIKESIFYLNCFMNQ